MTSLALWPAAFLDQRGNRRPGLEITVYEAGTGPEPDGDGTLVLAELFTDVDLTVPGPNPVTTDSDGNEVSIKAAPGYYDAYVGGETIRILVVDPSGGGTVDLSGIYVKAAIATETPGATVTLDLADGVNKRLVTLEEDTVLAIVNDENATTLLLIVETGAGGSAVSWWEGIDWGGSPPTVTTTANKRDCFALVRLGTNDWEGSVVWQGRSAPAAPDAPTGLSATAVSSTQIDLSWTAPSGTGITYIVERATTGGGTFAEIASGLTATSYSDTSLTAGTQRYYRVKAVNITGIGTPSSEANATTFDVPDAPTDVAGTPGDGLVSVSFTPPVSDGGTAITSYTVTVS